MTTKKIQESKIEFKQIRGDTKSVLYVLEKNADYTDSLALLDNADLRMLRYQEILPLLMGDETLKNQLKGYWFFLEGKGFEKELETYTIDEKGELIEIKGEISNERIVRVWNGQNPPLLGISSADPASCNNGRFFLNAYGGPRSVTPIVVGVPKQNPHSVPNQVQVLGGAVALRK